MHACLLLVLLAFAVYWPATILAAASQSEPPPQKLETLTTGTQTYSNVLVTSKSATHIIISHTRGMTSIRLSELDSNVLQQLGYEVKKPEPNRATEFTRGILDAWKEKTGGQQIDLDRVRALGTGILSAVAVGALAVYLFTCFCLRTICVKTGRNPGVLVWLPVFQAVPLLKAANMSVLWLPVLLLGSGAVSYLSVTGSKAALYVGAANALLSLLLSVVWCIKVSMARKKGALVGILLLIPVINIFAFLYLAFSD